MADQRLEDEIDRSAAREGAAIARARDHTLKLFRGKPACRTYKALGVTAPPEANGRLALTNVKG